MVANFIKREISEFTFSDEWLKGNMLFIAGPRQSGKTTLARRVLEEMGFEKLYYNWDIEKIRRRYRQDPDFIAKEASTLGVTRPYAVLDEIHKLTRWKNILKGLYDEYKEVLQIIVTGNARLDLLRRSGDSLVGRYLLVNLFPLSLKEWAGKTGKSSSPWLYEDADWENPGDAFVKKLSDVPIISEDLSEAYFDFGPFPAPLMSASKQRSRKWHRDYITLLIREDLRDLSGIRELDRVSHLVELIPHRIGSPLSLRNLAVDLEANHSTVQNWLQALKRLFLLWPLRPYSGKIHRSIRKEPKWYFLDWNYAASEAAQFENMIATSLYRFVVSLYDRGWPEVKLYYHRTYDKAEIDFLLYLEGKPILAIEAKFNAHKIPANLFRFRDRVNQQFPLVQVVKQPKVFLKKERDAYLVGYDRLMMIL
jgi:predicted AAA+ superfamily ATPase